MPGTHRAPLPPKAPAAKKNNFMKEVQIPDSIQELLDEQDETEEFHVEELGQVFQNLENDNLFLIQQIQEAEEQLELKKHESAEFHTHWSEEIRKLEKKEDELRSNIRVTEAQIGLLKGTSEDEDAKTLSDETLNELKL